MVLIGIIGGTGLENPNFFQQRTEIEVETTPWGDSGSIFNGFTVLRMKFTTQKINAVTVVAP